MSNAHSTAATSYDNSVKQTSGDQRELEARALLKTARRMQDIQSRWEGLDKAALNLELDDILTSNRKLWMLFYDTALENPENNRPNDLRSNIINLANFIFKRTIDAMASPEKSKLDILITINREIAAGLSQKVADKVGGKTEEIPAGFAGVSA